LRTVFVNALSSIENYNVFLAGYGGGWVKRDKKYTQYFDE